MASPQYSFLSSSGVKELATFGGKIDDLVPDEVARRLQEELGADEMRQNVEPWNAGRRSRR